MTAAEVAAYIGAAAWLPQIGAWIYRAVVKAEITMVPDNYAEVGFTTLGPIFNLRMAFTCEKKDAIIDGFEMLVAHEDGQTRTMRWSGMNETFSEIYDNAGNRQVVSREQNPIALKIGTESLIERFVRFQEPHYWEVVRPSIANLTAHSNFLKRSGEKNYASILLSSKERFEVCDIREKSFWWRPGRYTVTFQLSSPRKITLKHSRYSFSLTGSDLDNIIKSDQPGFEAETLNWNWANVNVKKVVP